MEKSKVDIEGKVKDKTRLISVEVSVIVSDQQAFDSEISHVGPLTWFPLHDAHAPK